VPPMHVDEHFVRLAAPAGLIAASGAKAAFQPLAEVRGSVWWRVCVAFDRHHNERRGVCGFVLHGCRPVRRRCAYVLFRA